MILKGAVGTYLLPIKRARSRRAFRHLTGVLVANAHALHDNITPLIHSLNALRPAGITDYDARRDVSTRARTNHDAGASANYNDCPVIVMVAVLVFQDDLRSAGVAAFHTKKRNGNTYSASINLRSAFGLVGTGRLHETLKAADMIPKSRR